MLPRAGNGTAELFCAAATGGGLGVFSVEDPELPVPRGSDLDGGGLAAAVDCGKKAPGRGGESGGVAAEPVEPEPVLEKLHVRMRCCCCC